MKILDFYRAVPEPRVIALGLFDSVHRGHQAVFSATVALAKEQGVSATAFTISGNVKGLPLYTEEDRLGLFESYGITDCVLAPFEKCKELSAKEFFATLLQNFHPVALVCGKDYTFGAGGKAGVDELALLCKEANLPLHVLEDVCLDGERVSTTKVKEMLSAGDLRGAEQALNRPYAMSGRVLHGYRIGTTLGFPTANLSVEGKFLPRSGVYFVQAQTPKGDFHGVANLGNAPTVEHRALLLETYLDGFTGDLYGENVTVIFRAFHRKTQTFAGVEQLKAQLQADVLAMRGYFSAKENL